MGRTKRQDSWQQLTARVSQEAFERLHLVSAWQHIHKGRILDALLLAYLPPLVGDPPHPSMTWEVPETDSSVPTATPTQPPFRPEVSEPPMPAPPALPMIPPPRTCQPTTQTLDTEDVKREMKRLRISLAEVGREFGITGRAVGGWFETGHIPEERQEGVRAIIERRRQGTKLPKRRRGKHNSIISK